MCQGIHTACCGDTGRAVKGKFGVNNGKVGNHTDTPQRLFDTGFGVTDHSVPGHFCAGSGGGGQGGKKSPLDEIFLWKKNCANIMYNNANKLLGIIDIIKVETVKGGMDYESYN